MSFYYQLRMLIWKNVRIRRQQKVRCIVELVWPIILFLILMWVRFRGLRTDIHECHFVQKAMPTAGGLPFLQSFICSFNNTCHKYEKNAQVKDKLNVSLLLNILEEYRNMPQNQNITEIQRTLSDIKKLYGLIGTINSRKKVNGSFRIPKFIKNPDSIREELKRRRLPLSPRSIDALLSSEVALSNIIEERFSPKYLGNLSLLLCNQTLMKNVLVNIQPDKLLYSELCSLSEKDVDNLISAVAKEADPNEVVKQVGSMFESRAYESLSMEELFELVRLSNSINNNIRNLQLYANAMGNVADISERYRNVTFRLKGRNTRWYEEIMEMVDLFLCGRNDTAEDDHDVSFQPGGNITRFDSLNDQLKGRVELLYEYDPSLSQKCNSIFQIFEESPFLKTVWRIYKPFVRGKILYSPRTNATERVMNNVNSTFHWIEQSITALHEISQYVSLAKEVFLDNAVALETVKQFIRSDIGLKFMNNSLVKGAFVNDSENEVEAKKDKIEDIQDTIERQLGDENTYRRTKLLANIQEILDNVTSFLECVDLDKVQPYQSEEDAVTAGMDLLETNKLLAVVVFENQTNDTLSPFVTYKIRMNSERVDNTQFIHDALRQPGPRMRPFIDLKYITFGFAYLQDLIEHYIIMEHTGLNKSDLPGIYLQQFPYPCYIDDQFVLAISRSFPLFMVLSWVYTSAMIVKSIVYEKEQRLKETMRVMGLGNSVHWVGWFIDSLIPMLLTIFLLTIILVYGKILSNAQPSLVYCFLLLYCMATIAQSFLISVFFSRANIAAASGGLIFFVLYLPYRFVVRWMLYLSPTSKILMCLSSNVAFGLGASYFSLYEESGTGLNWGVVRESPLFADEFSLFYVMIMLGVDCILYLILTWYIEAVAPGQFGVPKPWYFPFMLSYWCGNKYKKKRKSSLTERNGFVSKDNCEEEPSRLKVGISIHNLSMIYPNGKVAVKNFSLNFYEDQITSFLGHNGAGKTTTISILTGIYAPTSGTAYINGFDIRTNMDNIRNSLGMCPQHNVLFNLMSVEDHLYFYSMLRGKLRKKDVQNEVDQMIEDLQLPHKRTSLARDLSGGMQRKLSVAIAFIGGSKVVILDEPTSGVDPYSRRSIWELLMKYKRGRTVVLTTHYMDEADMLGDRIAIIANGRLQCCGSSLFLKNRFGRGYYLTIDLKQNGVSANTESPFIQKVHDHVSVIIPSAVFLEKIGSELIFILPQRNNILELKELFRSLELNKSALHIDSYGMSDTSLEEIFLRVADNAEPVTDNAEQGDSKADDAVPDSVSKICSGGYFKKLFRSKAKMEKRTALVNDIQEAEHSSVPIGDDHELLKHHSKGSWKQFKALHIKRYHHTKRKKKALFSELVLPGLFVSITLIMTSILPKFGGRPPLILKPSIYGDDLYVFNSIDEANETWAQKYYKNITGSQGLGMICSKNYEKYRYNDDDEKPCNEEIKFTNGSTNISSFGPDCSCSTGSQVCPVESGLPIPPFVELASRETMFDLSGSNISDWLLKTWKSHERNRLGGYNVGFKSPFPEISILDVIQFVVRNGSNVDDLYNSTRYKQNNIKVWFNNKAWAASVAYLNAINNVVLRSSLPQDKMGSADLYGIRAINHPMNFTKKQKEIEIIKESGISLLHAISVLFALSFVPASFTLYLIEERVSNSKHLQLVSGLKRHMYWFQAYTWDMCCYILSASLIIIIFLIFNEQAYISSRNFLAFVCLLFFYGYSCIPLMYPATYFFKIPSSAFVGLACGNMFIGLVTTLTTFVLSIFYDEELSSVNNVLKEVFLIFPHFCLGDGLMKLATNHFSYYQFQSLDIEIKNEIFKWNSIGKNLFWMFFSGNIFFCFALIIEYKLLKKLFCCKNSTVVVDPSNPNEDDDVKNEKNRVLYGDTSHDILKINCLTKVYNSITGTNVAVNQVCIGIKKGECFGLLGLNGAGKTTTFKMLTGALKPTSGDAFVNNHSIIKEKTTARSSIGYCPQFDALDSQLTPREHLEFYAHLRNIPSKHIPSIVERCIKKLDLDKYADRCSGTLSGGNKRKLSTAIAILGDPPLIFLDEPTSGMDPRARRFLWTCIQSLIRDGHSVILTSHSMEECQALCTKLTIMVNGTFRCLGSSQHLKSKFGGGYCLSIRCMDGESNVQLVKDYMTSHLDKAVLIEEHHTHLRFQIPQGSHPLPAVLEAVEEAHENKIVIDYSLSQTTLEDVFLQFAQEQTERSTVKGKFRLKSACCLPCSRCCRGDREQ